MTKIMVLSKKKHWEKKFKIAMSGNVIIKVVEKRDEKDLNPQNENSHGVFHDFQCILYR